MGRFPLAPARLTFVASSHLSDHFDSLLFSGAALEFVREADAAGWGESARDMAANRTFRADVFIRGAPKLSGAEIAARLGRPRLEAWPPRLEAERSHAKAATRWRGLAPEVAEL